MNKTRSTTVSADEVRRRSCHSYIGAGAKDWSGSFQSLVYYKHAIEALCTLNKIQFGNFVHVVAWAVSEYALIPGVEP